MNENKLKPGKILTISIGYNSSTKEEIIKLIWNIETDYSSDTCILHTLNLKTKRYERFYLTIEEACELNKNGVFFEKYKYSKEMFTVFKII